MEKFQVEEPKPFLVEANIDYALNSVVIKTIVHKATGSISALAFDAGEVLLAKISPFDTFIQIIDGSAEIIIDDRSNFMETGQSIIVPAHSRNTLKANIQFKMISTIIKSGYEE